MLGGLSEENIRGINSRSIFKERVEHRAYLRGEVDDWLSKTIVFKEAKVRLENESMCCLLYCACSC